MVAQTLCSSVGWSQDRREEPTGRSDVETSYRNAKPGYAPSALVIEVKPAKKTQEEAAAEERERRRQAQTDAWMVFLTAVLAFVAFAQTVVTAMTLRGLRHARTSAQAAETAADATVRSLAHMQDATERQLRAYVLVELGGIADFGPRQVPRASVRLVNAGQTPAYNVSVNMTVVLVSVDDTTDFPDPADVDRAELVIGPGVEKIYGHPATFCMLSLGVHDVVSRKALIAVGGSVIYDDVFGRAREVQFCHVFHGANLKGFYLPQLNRAN